MLLFLESGARPGLTLLLLTLILDFQDLPRTFPFHPWLRLEEGQNQLRQVLSAFALHNPQVS
jgi:hypothetical protein